jgi:hypothetical protein
MRRSCFLFLALSLTCVAAEPARWEGAFLARVGYDSNPRASGAGSSEALGDYDALTLSGAVNLSLRLPQGRLSYAGEQMVFDGLPEENVRLHRLALGQAVKREAWRAGFDASSVLVDGSKDLPASTAGVNANGLALWRERRAQWQHRVKAHALVHEPALGFARATAAVLDYDYRTGVQSGCVALTDRSDAQLGLDVGRRLDTGWSLGLRAGRQRQATIPLPGGGFEYSNRYHRLLLAWEAPLRNGRSLSLAAGPDVRRFTGAIDPVIMTDRRVTSLWFEASGALPLGRSAGLTAKATQWTFLSSTGKSAYRDLSFEVTATWTPHPVLGLSLGCRAQEADYFPAWRDDWHAAATFGARINLTRRVRVNLDLLRHEGWNGLAGMPGRAFRRTALTLGATQTF